MLTCEGELDSVVRPAGVSTPEVCTASRLVTAEGVGLARGGSALVAKVRDSGKSARMPELAGEVDGAVCAAAVELVCVRWRAGKGKRR